jgi:hypothetical protein
MRSMRICPICGIKVSKKGCLCVECSLKSNKKMKEPDMTGSFDTVQEISEGNINTRLREGFRLLQE